MNRRVVFPILLATAVVSHVIYGAVAFLSPEHKAIGGGDTGYQQMKLEQLVKGKPQPKNDPVASLEPFPSARRSKIVSDGKHQAKEPQLAKEEPQGAEALDQEIAYEIEELRERARELQFEAVAYLAQAAGLSEQGREQEARQYEMKGLESEASANEFLAKAYERLTHELDPLPREAQDLLERGILLEEELEGVEILELGEELPYEYTELRDEAEKIEQQAQDMLRLASEQAEQGNEEEAFLYERMVVELAAQLNQLRAEMDQLLLTSRVSE